METVIINDKEYQFIKAYREDERLRNSFDELAKEIHDIDFEPWYKEGYWSDSYIPYSLTVGDKIVANVSVNIMELMLSGETKRLIQLGTVMTSAEYRKNGLSRYLLQRIFKDYDSDEMFYLFANDTVLDFYPKFGFQRAEQYQYSLQVNSKKDKIDAEKLDLTIEKNRVWLNDKVRQSIPVAKLSMINNPGLVMFYCISFLKDCVYYIEEYDTVVIAEYNGDTVFLQDIYMPKEVPLNLIYEKMTRKGIRRVLLGFTPKEDNNYDILLLKEDTTLFIKNDKMHLLQNKEVMFPVLSHA